MDAKTAMDIGMKIAEDHERAVLSMMEHFPEVTTKQALHGNSVWLGTQIMKAICRSSEPQTA